MKSENHILQRNILRSSWHAVRKNRLDLKKDLMSKDRTIAEIRKNRDYKKLKKEQNHLSTMIKHIENKICREIKNES